MTLQASLTATLLPFIPPDILVAYEQARPGMGDKLIEWTERQQNHRISLETQINNRSQDRQDRAQKGSLAVALIGLLIAGATAAGGHEWAASIIAIVSVGGPVAATALASRIGMRSEMPKLPQVPKPNTAPPPDQASPPR